MDYARKECSCSPPCEGTAYSYAKGEELVGLGDYGSWDASKGEEIRRADGPLSSVKLAEDLVVAGYRCFVMNTRSRAHRTTEEEREAPLYVIKRPIRRLLTNHGDNREKVQLTNCLSQPGHDRDSDRTGSDEL